MKPREFIKKPSSTETQPFSGVIRGGAVDQAFSRVIADTGNEAIAAEEEGIPLGEYQERQGRRQVKPSNKKELREIFDAREKAFLLSSWVYDSIPAELQILKDVKIVNIFQASESETLLQGVWNYEIHIKERLTIEQLKEYLYVIVKDLEKQSGIALNPHISFSKNILDIISEIEIKIDKENRKNIKEYPSRELYNTSKPNFRYKVSFYLRRKIVIEKLKELVSLLRNYQLS